MPVQTRRQEMPEQRLSDIERVTARDKLTKSEKNYRELYMKKELMKKDFLSFAAMAIKRYLVGLQPMT